MLLAITTTTPPATDLGYLVHKHPERVQEFDLPFGKARLFFPALERFVNGEPLHRVHECAFAVLSMESEPVDPRL